MTDRAEHPILAARGGALGDFLVTLPALNALRQRFPGRRLELLTRPAYGAFAVEFGFADAWRSADSAGAGSLFTAGPEEPWLEWFQGFSEIVSWLPDPDEWFRRHAGPARFHQGLWRLTGSEPAAVQLAALDSGALPLASPVGRLPFPSPKTAGGPLAFHPGSGGKAKTWPFENWRAALRPFPRRELLLITGECEEEAAENHAAALRQDGWTVRHARLLSLPDLARELHSAAFFLGHDTGPAHLAAACGVSSHLLFGPTNPAVWGPAAPDTRILTAPGGNLARLGIDEVSSWIEPLFTKIARASP